MYNSINKYVLRKQIEHNMNSSKSNITWQSIVLITASFVLFCISHQSYYSEIFKDVLIGIISAVLLLLFIEVRDSIKDKKIYGFLAGEYKRMDIFNADLTATSDTKYSSLNLRYANINPQIKFNYKGNRKYEFEAEYEEGRKKAVIHLDQINPTEGNGVYQYSSKKGKYTLPDMGNFKLQVDSINPKRLYVYHNNLIPSGLAQGYEFWEKQ